MKTVIFVGDALSQIRAFPQSVRQDLGFQIDKIQRGEPPDDWKSMNNIGKNVREIRARVASGHYRVIYLATLKEAVYVLHAFKKKTQKTRKSDIDLSRKRLQEISANNG